MLPDTKMILRLVLALVWVFGVHAQEGIPIKTVTPREYQRIVDQVLPCPSFQIKESRDYQLCMTIIPPGHRLDERELLVVLTSSGGAVEMILRQPEQSIWQFASEASARDMDWRNGLQIRELRTRERTVIDRVVGSSWRRVTADLIPDGDFLMDPTAYKIRAQSITGTTSIDLTGPGAISRRQSSALLRWAEGVRRRSEAALKGQAVRSFEPSPNAEP